MVKGEGDKEYTLDNDIASLFSDQLPFVVRKALSKLTMVELMHLGRFLNAQLSKSYKRGADETPPKCGKE